MSRIIYHGPDHYTAQRLWVPEITKRGWWDVEMRNNALDHYTWRPARRGDKPPPIKPYGWEWKLLEAYARGAT